MSMASPTLRSSSSTLPEMSWRSWATDIEARPSTAEMDTGTTNTGARSVADFSFSASGSGGGGGVEGGRAVAEVEGAAGAEVAGLRAHDDRAGVADRLGGFDQRRVQRLGEFGRGGDHQSGSGLDLAGQGLQRGLRRRLREALEGRVGDGPRGGQ